MRKFKVIIFLLVFINIFGSVDCSAKEGAVLNTVITFDKNYFYVYERIQLNGETLSTSAKRNFGDIYGRVEYLELSYMDENGRCYSVDKDIYAEKGIYYSGENPVKRGEYYINFLFPKDMKVKEVILKYRGELKDKRILNNNQLVVFPLFLDMGLFPEVREVNFFIGIPENVESIELAGGEGYELSRDENFIHGRVNAVKSSGVDILYTFNGNEKITGNVVSSDLDINSLVKLKTRKKPVSDNLLNLPKGASFQEEVNNIIISPEKSNITDEGMNYHLMVSLIAFGVISVFSLFVFIVIRSEKSIKPQSNSYYYFTLNYEPKKCFGKVEPFLVCMLFNDDRDKILRLLIIDILGQGNLIFSKNKIVFNEKGMKQTGGRKIFLDGFNKGFPRGIEIIEVKKLLNSQYFDEVYDELLGYYKDYITVLNKTTYGERYEKLKLDVAYWKGIKTIFSSWDSYYYLVEKNELLNMTEVYQIALNINKDKLLHHKFKEEISQRLSELPFYNELYKRVNKTTLIDYLLD
ncbi:MAG: hypothetical protein ACRC2K_13455 [Clostridium sp.]